jgi:hypothetical protein
MFRKVFAATVVGIVLSGTLFATSAGAATTTIANGTLCPKAGAKKTTNANTYFCSLNTVVNKTKLTWTTVDCVNANKQYNALNNQYLAVAKALPATLADLDVKIAAEIQKGVEAAAKADALDLQVKDWQAKIAEYTTHQNDAIAARDKLIADVAHSAVNKTAIDTYNRAITSLSSAIRSLNAAIRGAQTAATSQRKVGKTAETMKTVRAQAVTELAQAKAGVDQALSLRKVICQKGL